MFSTLRATLAAAAIALAGLGSAGTADAKVLVVGPGKLGIHLCVPHFEKRVHTLGIRKIGLRYYRVVRIDTVFVNRFCFKRVVSSRLVYIPLPYYAAPGV